MSLFSFQDIITGLCGIMIFLVLVQVVDIVLGGELTASRLSRESAAMTDDRATLRAEVARLERKLAKAREASARAVVAAPGKARPGDAERLRGDLTEKERTIAALVSQVHDLETQVEAARDADAADAARVREMERTRRLLEQQVAGMKGRRGVTLIPERGEFKTPVYVVCSWTGLEVYRPLEGRKAARFAAGEAIPRLEDFLKGLDHTTHTIVLLVRPSGVKLMDRAVVVLMDAGFTYGRDPLEEDIEVAFAAGEGR